MTGSKQYEKPTIVTYGSVRELTLGTGNLPTMDSVSSECGPASGGRQSNTPSHVTCVVG